MQINLILLLLLLLLLLDKNNVLCILNRFVCMCVFTRKLDTNIVPKVFSFYFVYESIWLLLFHYIGRLQQQQKCKMQWKNILWYPGNKKLLFLFVECTNTLKDLGMVRKILKKKGSVKYTVGHEMALRVWKCLLQCEFWLCMKMKEECVSWCTQIFLEY